MQIIMKSVLFTNNIKSLTFYTTSTMVVNWIFRNDIEICFSVLEISWNMIIWNFSYEDRVTYEIRLHCSTFLVIMKVYFVSAQYLIRFDSILFWFDLQFLFMMTCKSARIFHRIVFGPFIPNKVISMEKLTTWTSSYSYSSMNLSNRWCCKKIIISLFTTQIVTHIAYDFRF